MKRLARRAVLAYSIRNRHRKAVVISDHVKRVGAQRVVMVGCTIGTAPNEQIVEKAVAEQVEWIAGFDLWEGKPTFPYFRADGRQMPLADSSVDYLLSQAVIEHVGGEDDQRRFVEEHLRVGSAWAITTPNKWFPVESHTSAVFLHWLPRWRRRRSEFTRLLSRREFKSLLPEGTTVRGWPWSATFVALHG